MSERFYEPVKTGLSRSMDDCVEDEDYADWPDLAIYAVRPRNHSGRMLGSDLRLNSFQADALCDVLEEVRREALGSLA